MKPKLVLVFLAVVAVGHSKRPPWYKPCWIYMCGLDVTDPVCAWDPHHGARLFRNDCDMDRHNFCYNRNYAIVDGENTVDQDTKLCDRLKKIVRHDDEKTSVVQDGNVRVHFLEDPNGSLKQRRSELRDRIEEKRQKMRERFNEPRKYHDHYGHKKSRYNHYDISSSEDDSSYET